MKKNDSLKKEFDKQMALIFERALNEVNIGASQFIQMLQQHGGVTTAKILINV